MRDKQCGTIRIEPSAFAHGHTVNLADALVMRHSPTTHPTQRPYSHTEFEIGDRVCLIANPHWIGGVVARSLSVDVHVLWDHHGVEKIDSRLLRLVD